MYKVIFCFLIMPLGAFQFQQDDLIPMKNVEAFQKGLKKATANTYSIQATFEQKKYLSILSNAIESSGTMLFKKPGLLKWSYTSPYNYAILLDGDQIKINDEGKINSFEIKNSKTFKALNDLIINSVQGNVLHDQRFNISYFENGTNYMARLEPKDSQFKNYISRIDVFFNKKDFIVSKIQLFEPSEDYTLINFKNQEINGEISDSAFSFDPN